MAAVVAAAVTREGTETTIAKAATAAAANNSPGRMEAVRDGAEAAEEVGAVKGAAAEAGTNRPSVVVAAAVVETTAKEAGEVKAAVKAVGAANTVRRAPEAADKVRVVTDTTIGTTMGSSSSKIGADR